MSWKYVGSALLLSLSSAFSEAGVSKQVLVRGKVWSFDHASFKVQDARGKLWLFSRKILPQRYELVTDHPIVIQVYGNELRPG